MAELDHKTIEKEIPDFLEDRLSNKELEQFLDHMDHCASCQDELSIQYLVRRGLPKLETDGDFSLNQELSSYMTLQKNRLRIRTRLGVYAYTLELFTLIVTLTTIVLMTVFLL